MLGARDESAGFPQGFRPPPYGPGVVGGNAGAKGQWARTSGGAHAVGGLSRSG